MDKNHKLITFITILYLFDLTIAETIHFTNDPERVSSQNFTTYQLQVPGSKPITIIEAEIGFGPSHQPQQYQKYTEPPTPYSGNRRVSQGHSNDNNHGVVDLTPYPVNAATDNDLFAGDYNSTKKTVFSPSLLEKFLKDYERNTGIPEVTPVEDDVKLDPAQEYFDSMERKHHRPNSGWVSLDAVPTHTSAKIYKWQSDAQRYRPIKPSYSQSYWENEEDNYRPNRPNYDNYYSESNFDENEPYHVPPKPFGSMYPSNQRPYNRRPAGYHSNKPYYNDEDDESDRRYHNKRPQNDIIIDQRPTDFPQDDNRRYGMGHHQSSGNRRPATYPENGDGKWVLVSASKAGQFVRQKKEKEERKEKVESSTLPSFNTRTSLTVRKHPRAMNFTTREGIVIEMLPKKAPIGGPEPTTKRPKRMSLLNPATDNTLPVLAGVGAGLVPASLALVAPMVLGRRRRRSIYETDSSPLFLKRS